MATRSDVFCQPLDSPEPINPFADQALPDRRIKKNMFRKLFGFGKPAQRTAPVSQARKPAHPSQLKAVPAEKKQKGFDPYNSGAFKRENAWERVIRR